MLYSKKMVAEVENVTPGEEKYVVAKLCEDNKLWYWGRWEKKEDAEKIAEEVGGLVLEDEL